MLNIVFLLLGFVFGYIARKDDIEKVIAETKKKIEEERTVKPGIIHRPTGVQLAERKLPQKIQEGNQAMRESLAQFPELQKRSNIPQNKL